MLETVSGYIRKISGEVEKSEKRKKMHIEGIKVFFRAPNPKHPSTEESLTKEEEKFTEANFQWVAYQTLFTLEPEMENYYIYNTPLEPQGDGKEPAKVFDSDSKWSGTSKGSPSTDYTTGDVIRAFPELLKGPLLPREGNIGPEKFGQTTYINVSSDDKGHVYSSKEFKQFFDSDFYVVLNPHTKELRNPFNKSIGMKH
jgi:hypothetical protein